MKKNVLKIGVILAFLFAGFTACNDEMGDSLELSTYSLEADFTALDVPTPSVDPILSEDGKGGNTSCAMAAELVGVESFEYSSGKIDYENGAFADDFPGELNVRTDGTYVSWTFTPTAGYCLVDMVVIVKGGNASNVYYYDDGTASDAGLSSPDNASGKPAGLSNLTFCWNLVKCGVCGEFKGETAWAANGQTAGLLRYNTRGNWATYVAYNNVAKTTTQFAGQNIPVGTVQFSAVATGKVTITINLTGDWIFAEVEKGVAVEENVKIQDYSKAPSGNPSPGLFAWKGTASGNTFTIEVPANKFYGVHVDVGNWMEVDCE